MNSSSEKPEQFDESGRCYSSNADDFEREAQQLWGKAKQYRVKADEQHARAAELRRSAAASPTPETPLRDRETIQAELRAVTAKIEAYDVGDRPMSPPARLLREKIELETEIGFLNYIEPIQQRTEATIARLDAIEARIAAPTPEAEKGNRPPHNLRDYLDDGRPLPAPAAKPVEQYKGMCDGRLPTSTIGVSLLCSLSKGHSGKHEDLEGNQWADAKPVEGEGKEQAKADKSQSDFELIEALRFIAVYGGVMNSEQQLLKTAPTVRELVNVQERLKRRVEQFVSKVAQHFKLTMPVASQAVSPVPMEAEEIAEAIMRAISQAPTSYWAERKNVIADVLRSKLAASHPSPAQAVASEAQPILNRIIEVLNDYKYLAMAHTEWERAAKAKSLIDDLTEKPSAAGMESLAVLLTAMDEPPAPKAAEAGQAEGKSETARVVEGVEYRHVNNTGGTTLRTKLNGVWFYQHKGKPWLASSSDHDKQVVNGTLVPADGEDKG